YRTHESEGVCGTTSPAAAAGDGGRGIGGRAVLGAGSDATRAASASPRRSFDDVLRRELEPDHFASVVFPAARRTVAASPYLVSGDRRAVLPVLAAGRVRAVACAARVRSPAVRDGRDT